MDLVANKLWRSSQQQRDVWGVEVVAFTTSLQDLELCIIIVESFSLGFVPVYQHRLPHRCLGNWVLGTMLTRVIVVQTECAPRNRTCPSRIGLVVEAGISGGPIKVLAGQGLPPKLSVMQDPAACAIILLRPNNRGLVRKKFRGLLWEPGCQSGCHQGVTFHPCGDIRDWEGVLLVVEGDQEPKPGSKSLVISDIST